MIARVQGKRTSIVRRASGIAVGVLVAVAAAAQAGIVRFPVDSLPAGVGTHVLIDFNPSRRAIGTETANSISFFLPRRWRLDRRAVVRECTPTQASAQRCPARSRIGYGHVVLHLSGYLFPGGETDAVGYMVAFLAPPASPGDPAAIVLQVQLLGVDQLFAAANRYLKTKLRPRYSITGRVIRLRTGSYGLKGSFDQMPGGITLPAPLQAAGLSAKVTRFKLELGAVRRVRVPFIRRIRTVGINGPQTLVIHDHLLVGRHLFSKSHCPANRAWPWKLQVGFPEGTRTLTGTVGCR